MMKILFYIAFAILTISQFGKNTFLKNFLNIKRIF